MISTPTINKHGIKTVLWVHNTPKVDGMFLGDVKEGLVSLVSIKEAVIPLRPTIASALALIAELRQSEQDVDLVHAQFGSLTGLLASFTKKPSILSLRGTDFYRLPSRSIFGRIESFARQLMTFIACLRADVIIVMSNRMRRELLGWPFMTARQIVVIPDPIGKEFWEHRTLDREPANWNVPFEILVGSLMAANPVKRTWLVERAVALCQTAGLQVTLNVMSGMPRKDVLSSMQAADLIALTSTHEGWPNIIKEGMALGVPFISTDVSDLADYCLLESPNKIVIPSVLDISLAIVDAMVAKSTKDNLSLWLTEVVAIKHFIVYLYINARLHS